MLNALIRWSLNRRGLVLALATLLLCLRPSRSWILAACARVPRDERLGWALLVALPCLCSSTAATQATDLI